MVKICENCGKQMVRPRWANGKLDSTFKKRRFCSRKCCADFRLKDEPPTDNAGRRRAQKAKSGLCQVCGCGVGQVHHLDRNPKNNDDSNLILLCQKCHVAAHVEKGDWGRGRKLTEKKCPVCGESFRPKKERQVLCGKRQCLQEYGRQNAMKRWYQASG